MEFRTATCVDHAVDLLGELGPDARLLAGGTDVMIQRQRGEVCEPVLVHLERLGELRSLTISDGIRIDALVTHRMLCGLAMPPVGAGLREASRSVGGWQTQNVGTVVGNLCNASPAADLMPPLLTLDTSVLLRSRSGHRSVPLVDFVLGRRSIDRHPDELVVGLQIELPTGRSGSAYTKVGRRRAMEVAIAGIAVRVTLDDDGRLAEVAIAACSVGPSPRRFPSVEACVLEGGADDQSLAEASALLRGLVEPVDDVRASADYRRQVTGRVLPRTIRTAITRAGNGQVGGTP
jgi:carbon-monoxide dehydrogenase medium subunit